MGREKWTPWTVGYSHMVLLRPITPCSVEHIAKHASASVPLDATAHEDVSEDFNTVKQRSTTHTETGGINEEGAQPYNVGLKVPFPDLSSMIMAKHGV